MPPSAQYPVSSISAGCSNPTGGPRSRKRIVQSTPTATERWGADPCGPAYHSVTTPQDHAVTRESRGAALDCMRGGEALSAGMNIRTVRGRGNAGGPSSRSRRGTPRSLDRSFRDGLGARVCHGSTTAGSPLPGASAPSGSSGKCSVMYSVMLWRVSRTLNAGVTR